MTMNEFSGGLSKRLSPNLIQLNESTVCTNVDLTTGSIKPLKDLDLTNIGSIPLNSNGFTYYKGSYVSDNISTTFLEYGDSLYKSNGVDTIKKSNDGINFYNLGITAPTTAPTTVSPFTISFTISALTTGVDIPAFIPDSYKYLIMYKTNLGAIAYERQTIDYTGTKGLELTISSVSNIEFVRLFRVYDGKYRLIEESTTSTTIKDTVFDISTKSTISTFDDTLEVRQYVYTYYSSLTSKESAPSPASVELSCRINLVNLSDIITSSDTTVDIINIYRVGGSLTSYFLVDSIPNGTTTYIDTKDGDTEVVNNNLLETQGYTRPLDGLKYLTEYGSALFASIDNTLYFSNSGAVDVWLSINFIGFSDNITGLGATQNGLLVFSNNKTWIITGNDLSNYSKHLLSGNQGCVSHNTISYVENNLVWLSLDGVVVSSGGNIELLSWPKLGTVSLVPVKSCVYENQYFLLHSQGILVIDFRHGVRFYSLNLPIRSLYYNSYIDKLQMLKVSDTSIYNYNSSSSYLPLTYRTGWIAENGVTNYKSYKTIYITCIGQSSLLVYINNNQVLEQELVNGLNTVMVPQQSSKGYYIELQFEGTGTILEINFTVEGRQNGH